MRLTFLFLRAKIFLSVSNFVGVKSDDVSVDFAQFSGAVMQNCQILWIQQSFHKESNRIASMINLQKVFTRRRGIKSPTEVKKYFRMIVSMSFGYLTLDMWAFLDSHSSPRKAKPVSLISGIYVLTVSACDLKWKKRCDTLPWYIDVNARIKFPVAQIFVLLTSQCHLYSNKGSFVSHILYF